MQKNHPEIVEEHKINELQQRLKKRRYSAEYRLNEAMLLFDKQEYALALELLKDIEHTFHGLAYVFDLVGRCYAEQDNDYCSAEHYLKRAIALDPDCPEFHYGLALTYVRNGKMHGAVDELALIDLNEMVPENKKHVLEFKTHIDSLVRQEAQQRGLSREVYLKNNRLFIEGCEFVYRGLYRQGIKKFEAVLTSDSKHAPVYGNIGLAYMFLGDFSKAEHYFSRALSCDPQYSFAKNNLAALPALKKGEKRGIGVSTEMFTSTEQALIPLDIRFGFGSESAVFCSAFYQIKNKENVVKALKNSDEFEIIESGVHYYEIEWSRKNPDSLFDNAFPQYLDTGRSTLGHLILRWDDLMITTMSVGRLRVLHYLFAEKYKLMHDMVLMDEYFEEAVPASFAGKPFGTNQSLIDEEVV